MSVVVPFERRAASDPEAAEQQPACTDRNPEWWFDERQFARGKRLCARCVVRERCLNEALVNGERLGVWGGLTPAERASLPDAVVVPFRRRRR
jgi:hypothetical protein